MMRRLTAIVACLAALHAIDCAGARPEVKVSDPQCCFLTAPLGIETPSFSWKLEASANGAGQGAYQVQIGTRSGKNDVWDSGKVLSEDQFGITAPDASFESGRTYYWRARIWDSKGNASGWCAPQTFSTGILSEEDWNAEWITYPWSPETRMPYMRKEFDVKGKVARATAYVCGLGAGDLYVNGSLADPSRILDPAQTNYEDYALYSAIDVTALLSAGRNCLGVMLGDGWFNQGTVFADFSYGHPMLRMQLVIEYASGKKDVVGTDTSWLWREGPVVKANIYSGEVYDARMEVDGWSVAGCPTEGWSAVTVATKGVPPVTYSQTMPAIRTKEAIPAAECWKTEDGKWIFDFGSNNTANILLKASLPAGTRVTVRTGEEVMPDRQSVDFRSTGISVVPVQTDEYICAGRPGETWMPRFTYHGFRYAEMSFSDPSVVPSKEWLSAVPVHTDLAVKGTFTCSDPQLNRLHEMCLRTVRGNIVGVPMDCPTREKCGWLGDSHAYIKMLCDNYDVDYFVMKYLEDIRSGADREEKNTLHHLLRNSEFYFTDKAAGIPYMIAPGKRLCGVASPDWGTAVVQLPWHLYLYNGNRAALEKYYPSMKQWTDYISSIAVGNIVYQGLGDWDPPYGNANMLAHIPFTSSAFHYYDVSIMAEAAAVLGKDGDAAKYAALREDIRKAMTDKFYDPVVKTFGSQTADAMALDMGICPDGAEKDVARSIVRSIRLAHNFFSCGIFGLARIGSAMSRNGQAEAAFKYFTKKGNYSFEYMWSRYDATTMWECLPITDNTYETIHSSHCHPMQAGLDIWFYEDLAGIRPAAPGFRKILLAPCLDCGLEAASASIDTHYGVVSSSWKKSGATFVWDVTVPAGTSATVELPKGMKLSGSGSTKACVLESGSHTLTVVEE